MIGSRRLLLCLLLGSQFACRGVSAPTVHRGLPFYDSADFTARWHGASAGRHRIAPFALLDQEGQSVTRDALEGRIHIASFIYTNCAGICPLITRRLTSVYDAVRDDPEVLLVSYSVTPEVDTVEVLGSFAEERGVESDSWKLVTGERAAIYRLARDSYFADEDLGGERTADDFLHTERVMLVDQELRIRGIYNGTLPVDMLSLIADVATLKKELPG